MSPFTLLTGSGAHMTVGSFSKSNNMKGKCFELIWSMEAAMTGQLKTLTKGMSETASSNGKNNGIKIKSEGD